MTCARPTQGAQSRDRGAGGAGGAGSGPPSLGHAVVADEQQRAVAAECSPDRDGRARQRAGPVAPVARPSRPRRGGGAALCARQNGSGEHGDHPAGVDASRTGVLKRVPASRWIANAWRCASSRPSGAAGSSTVIAREPRRVRWTQSASPGLGVAEKGRPATRAYRRPDATPAPHARTTARGPVPVEHRQLRPEISDRLAQHGRAGVPRRPVQVGALRPQGADPPEFRVVRRALVAHGDALARTPHAVDATDHEHA